LTLYAAVRYRFRMQNTPDKPITNAEAYAQLHEALIVLQRRHPVYLLSAPTFAETTLDTARTAITALQIALLQRMDQDQDRTSKS
jgi:hypothetical protein